MRSQRVSNAWTNVFPLSTIEGDYEMIPSHTQKEQNSQTKWRCPMMVEEANHFLEFVVEDMLNA